MIKHYENFTKNGVYSGDMGVTHVSLSSDLYDEAIGGNRTIVEQQNSQTDQRHFKRISTDPIEFEMALLLDDELTDSQIEDIKKWLLNDYYEEMYFEDELDKIYYCLPTSQPRISHNGLNQGVITISFRCYDQFIYSREIVEPFDLSANPIAGTTITLLNQGHVEVYPILTIEHKEANVSIENLTTGETLHMSGIAVGEIITIDNRPEKEEITTSASPNAYRYDNHNDIFMRIVGTSNQFKVIGKCILTVKYRYKRKF